MRSRPMSPRPRRPDGSTSKRSFLTNLMPRRLAAGEAFSSAASVSHETCLLRPAPACSGLRNARDSGKLLAVRFIEQASAGGASHANFRATASTGPRAAATQAIRGRPCDAVPPHRRRRCRPCARPGRGTPEPAVPAGSKRRLTDGRPAASQALGGPTRSSDDPDRHIGQAVELGQQHVTLDHRADILRRARIDDVAGLQLEGLRQFRDLLGDAPDHLAEI